MSVCPNCQCSTLKLVGIYRKCDVCRFTIKESDLEETYYGGLSDNSKYRPGKHLLEKNKQNTTNNRKAEDEQ